MPILDKIGLPRFCDGVLGVFFRLPSSDLPARWFRAPVSLEPQRKAEPKILTAGIVSHCWRYSNLLVYQLSSAIDYPPSKLKLIVTVLYSRKEHTFRWLAGTDGEPIDRQGAYQIHTQK